LGEMEATITASRIEDGLCGTCGTRLLERKKGSLFSSHKTKLKPVNVPGDSLDGQCLRCPTSTGGNSSDATSDAAAIAIAAMGDLPSSNNTHQSPPPAASVAAASVDTEDTAHDAPIQSNVEQAVNLQNSFSWHTNNASFTQLIGMADDSDLDAAIAASLMEADRMTRDAVAVPFTPSSMTMTRPEPYTCRAQYAGERNTFGDRHGSGFLTWPNGDIYEGNFDRNNRHGQGALRFTDGTEYVGQWQNNIMHGEGTRRFTNGNVYTGTYVDGIRSGQGRCYFFNGDMYVGAWRNDQMSGFGRYYYQNGQSFEGNFINGKREGKGKYQLSDGRVDVYCYSNDKRSGAGVRWSRDRKKAWRLMDGKQKGKVSIEEAVRIGDRCGPDRMDDERL